MVSTNQFKNGMALIVEGTLFQIIDFQHVKPGKGGAFVRTKLKNVKTGAVIDRTFRAGEDFEQAHLDKSEAQFLYKDGDAYHFMDNETFEQIELSLDFIGQNADLLKEGMSVNVERHDGNPIGVELQMFVELEIVHTEPGFKGNTATNVLKPAEMETGATIQVPLFIEIGEKIKIDTRTREYISRA